MGYTTTHDKMLSKIHGYEVYRYICDKCGKEVDCNGRFDKKPEAIFCKYCGHKLEG